MLIGCARGAPSDRCSIRCCVGDSWRWALSCGVELSGGFCLLDPWLLVELACGSCAVKAQSGFSEAVRAINNLATAQVRKETPSLIDVKGPGRPKEFSGREEDFQQWSMKTEAFFAGVIKESEMMLECAAADAHSTHGSHEL